MKKFLLALIVLAAAASVASAGVGITWNTGGGWAEAHDSVGASTPLLANNGALWQLIYAGADNIANPINGSGSADPANDYVAVGSDDVVWAERTIAQSGGTAPQDGTQWDEWLGLSNTEPAPLFTDLAWTTAGFVYQRVFESIMPVTGTWFYQTGLLALDTTFAGGVMTPQSFYIDENGGLGPILPNQQAVVAGVIPEPATMGLMGLGALVLAIRRRRA